MKSAKTTPNKLIVCNWKTLITDPKDAKKLLASYKKLPLSIKKNFIVAPSLPFLPLVSENGFKAASQSISTELSGATTGLVSAEIIKKCKATHVLLGHSEERARGLTANELSLQIKRALEQKLVPIVCVGETQRDPEGHYFAAFKQQLTELYSGLSKLQIESIILAYEPIWAIGAAAKRPATVLEAEEMIIYAKRFVTTSLFGNYKRDIKILYGGSVNELNAREFFDSHHIAGLLLGRASTEIKVMNKLVSTLITR